MIHAKYSFSPDLALLLGRQTEVDVVDVPPHLLELLLRDLQPELPLRLGEPGPELAPRGELLLVGEVELHLLGGVAGVERGLVALCRHGSANRKEISLLLWLLRLLSPLFRDSGSSRRAPDHSSGITHSDMQCCKGF